MVPEKLQKIPFRERQRARMLKARVAERKTVEQSAAGVAQAVTTKKPMFILIAIGLFVLVGSVLVSRSCTVAKVQTGPTRKHMTAARELAAIYGGIEGFKYDCGEYPDESNGLKSLLFKFDNPKWNGPYVNFLRSDPWKHPYFYSLAGTGFVVKSLGPDGIESVDDIVADADWTNYVEFAPNPPTEPAQ